MSSGARIIGLDPSLTSTGVAVFDGERFAVSCYGRKGKRDETIRQRWQRVDTLVTDVVSAARWNVGDLVVIEAPSFGSIGGSVVDRNGLWWDLVGCAYAAGARVATVAPKTRAKWATGSGTADKAAVGSAVTRLFPDLHLPNSDSADAVVLALMGAHWLDWLDISVDTKYRAECLNVVKWPDLEEIA